MTVCRFFFLESSSNTIFSTNYREQIGFSLYSLVGSVKQESDSANKSRKVVLYDFHDTGSLRLGMECNDFTGYHDFDF